METTNREKNQDINDVLHPSNETKIPTKEVLSNQTEEETNILYDKRNTSTNFQPNWTLKFEKYSSQISSWPSSGKHILAHFNEKAIVVYQAYNEEIATYAVQNQKFGGPKWSSTRMTWIKPNFLWMMFRSNWGQKKNQERILAIWLKRESFDRYLMMGMDIHSEKTDSKCKGTVRIQWDPDHLPNGERHPFRKAIQIGLKNVETFISGDDILLIQDVADYVSSQQTKFVSLKPKDFELNLVMPMETIYHSETAWMKGPEKPLRVMLCFKGKKKAAILQIRSEQELLELIWRKLKVKAKTITLSSSGEQIDGTLLLDLPQDSTFNIS